MSCRRASALRRTGPSAADRRPCGNPARTPATDPRTPAARSRSSDPDRSDARPGRSTIPRPPARSSRSSTVTRYPLAPRRIAAARPPRPAPMTMARGSGAAVEMRVGHDASMLGVSVLRYNLFPHPAFQVHRNLSRFVDTSEIPPMTQVVSLSFFRFDTRRARVWALRRWGWRAGRWHGCRASDSGNCADRAPAKASRPLPEHRRLRDPRDLARSGDGARAAGGCPRLPPLPRPCRRSLDRLPVAHHRARGLVGRQPVHPRRRPAPPARWPP